MENSEIESPIIEQESFTLKVLKTNPSVSKLKKIEPELSRSFAKMERNSSVSASFSHRKLVSQSHEPNRQLLNINVPKSNNFDTSSIRSKTGSTKSKRRLTMKSVPNRSFSLMNRSPKKVWKTKALGYTHGGQ